MLPFFSPTGSPGSISDVFEECPNLERQLDPFHPVKSAALVAGLLTEPSFQANTLRLERLIHLLIAFGSGRKKPRDRDISRWLNKELGMTIFSQFEDPLEDVFVSNVITDEGNVRIFEGTWESSDFYLQRILNVVEKMPDDQDFLQMKLEIRALLKLSEEITTRRQLARFSSGGGEPKGTMKIPSLEKLKQLRQTLTFSTAELDHLGVSPSDLSPFIFESNLRSQLKKQAIGDSLLEQCPIVYDATKWTVLLPTAISIAVRRHVLDGIASRGYQESFNKHFTEEYWNFLSETPLLGTLKHRNEPIFPKKISGKIVFDFVMGIDEGRYLQVISIVDGIEGYLNHGFSASEQDEKELSKEIDIKVKEAKSHFCHQKGFKQGMTLLIGCGYGRPSIFYHSQETANWWVEIVSAPERYILGWISESSPFLLWKLAKQKRFLRDQGISIHNINGFLNLYSWWLDTDYMLLHSDIELGGDPIRLVIPTNCLLETRKKVRSECDRHVLPLPSGQFARVQKGPETYFKEKDDSPQYRCIDSALRGELRGAWVGEKVVWWLAVEPGKSKLSRNTVLRLFEAVYHWMERAAPIFEDCIQGNVFQVVMIVLDFNEMHQDQADPVPAHLLPSLLSVSTDREKSAVRVSFRDPFLGGVRNPKNEAERNIIKTILIGVLRLLDIDSRSDEELDCLVQKIVPNEDARYVHTFEAKCFRDYIQSYDFPKGIKVDKADNTISQLEVGCVIKNIWSGDRFTEANESVSFLNKVVDVIWKRIRTRLKTLDRANLIEYAFRNIEGNDIEQTRWDNTIRATLALHEKKGLVKGVAIEKNSHFIAAKIASRLIIEMAISECPLDGGMPAGKLNLTSLMADTLYLFHLGGLSDAIYKKVMDPKIQIMPSGFIKSHTGFRVNILEPLGRENQSSQFEYAEENYEKLYEPFKPVRTVSGSFPEAFLIAFESELGISVDALRGVRDTFENLAIEKQKCVFISQRNEILSYCNESKLASLETGKIVLDRFALWPRKSWDTAPEGFAKKDWYPWRFGRRLSLLDRPIVRLEDGENPRHIISPGLLATGVSYILDLYFKAKIEASETESSKMKSWIDSELDRRGHEFAQKVFNAVQNLGYKARLESKVTALLNEKQDRDWGDVDILAWKPGGSNLMAIECKNLRQAKTPNEIAEQLNNFKGEIRSDGERDDLLKHLDRCEYLRSRIRPLTKNLKFGDKDINIQTVVCFSKPVPMQHVAQQFPDVTFQTIDDLL